MINADELENSTRVFWGDEYTPFTRKDYVKLNKFDEKYIPIKFEINDSKIFLLPNKSNFKLEIETYMYMNRFWKYSNGKNNKNQNQMKINLKGVEWNDLKFLNMEYIKDIMFSMSIYHFGYDFALMPHKRVTSETYDRYRLFMKTFQYDNTGELIPVATKPEIKATHLAVEYLHFLEFFGNKNTTKFMIDNSIINNFNNWFSWQNLSTEEKKLNQSLNNKVNVLKTTINRISGEIFIHYGRGKARGTLTKKAIEFYKYWNYSQSENDFENWLIYEFGVENK